MPSPIPSSSSSSSSSSISFCSAYSHRFLPSHYITPAHHTPCSILHAPCHRISAHHISCPNGPMSQHHHTRYVRIPGGTTRSGGSPIRPPAALLPTRPTQAHINLIIRNASSFAAHHSSHTSPAFSYLLRIPSVGTPSHSHLRASILNAIISHAELRNVHSIPNGYVIIVIAIGSIIAIITVPLRLPAFALAEIAKWGLINAGAYGCCRTRMHQRISAFGVGRSFRLSTDTWMNG